MMGRCCFALSCGLLLGGAPLQSAFALKFGSDFEADRPSVAAVAANPKTYIDKLIGFRNATCVDQRKSGFLCVVSGGGRTVQIEAMGLGPSGGDVVAERLIGPCKGTDKLGEALCRFDFECKPISVVTEPVMMEFEGIRAAKLICGVIEMRVAGRK